MNSRDQEIRDCVELARSIRKDVLRMTYEKKAPFIASSFSCADILAVLFHSFIQLDISQMESLENDVFILSKGHASSAWYATLANIGVFDRERLFREFNITGFDMGVHSKRNSLPGILTSSGSLGQGLGIACGIALADKICKRKRRTFVVVGDGECNEGSIWEGFLFASRYRLDNLVVIVDRNRMSSYGDDHQILNLGDMATKLCSFGWNAQDVNGHDCAQIYRIFTETLGKKDFPTAIIANTIKGNGVTLFENNVLWHYKWPEEEHFLQAMKELDA
jgi:transketolase